jgi:Mlc titration factor MtfA (ptsG expression regulator)
MGFFDWLFRRKQLRREEILARPFPEPWLDILRWNVRQFARLPDEHQQLLPRLVQIFLAEKTFLGSGGQKLTDEIRVTIAAQACLLLLGLPHLGVYPRLREVIVYPRDFGEIVEAVGPDGRPYRIPHMHAGEAWRGGPVVLAWDEIEHSAVSPCEGFNVVFHEFAHVLDMMKGGGADGIPPLMSKEQYAAWSRVFDASYQAHSQAARTGQPTFLDPYGASSPVEFFAVVTEHFFEQPRQLQSRHPDLYDQMRIFYNQDPVRWRHPRTGHWA